MAGKDVSLLPNLEGAPDTDPFDVRDALVSAVTPLADTRTHTEDLLNVSDL